MDIRHISTLCFYDPKSAQKKARSVEVTLKMTFLTATIRDVKADGLRVGPSWNEEAEKNGEGITSRTGFEKIYQTENVGNPRKRRKQTEMSARM
jgi:hypothetical protein